MSATPVLQVDDVHVWLGGIAREHVHILDGVSLSVAAGEIVGVIGETGSGKTTLARTVAGLVKATAGSIQIHRQEVTGLGRRGWRDLRRAGTVQLVFQDSLRSVDPDMTIGAVISEGLELAGRGDQAHRGERVANALQRVGLEPALAGRRAREVSGGQRQRVSIARAIAMEPKLLICDEPVSALDASNRNRILRLLLQLRDELGLGIVIISHDLASLAGVVDRVAVLYRGQILESGPAAQVFGSPAQPYSALLIASGPRTIVGNRGLRLLPAQLRADETREATGKGCPFAPDCRFATEICSTTEPAAVSVGDGWTAACHHVTEWRDQLTTQLSIGV
jgi:oligopeptide/dipeptide ABC transporter ATP-binding protein